MSAAPRKLPSLDERAAGLLLHPTSLPGPHGSGDLGREAHAFLDFLAAAGQRYWQMLPVVPPAGGNSPYQSTSAFAASPLLLSLEALADDGLLSAADLVPEAPLEGPLGAGSVDFAKASRFRMSRLERAFEAFRADRAAGERLFVFAEQERSWLDDYALYAALKDAHGDRPWNEWPAPLRARARGALEAAAHEHRVRVRFHQFLQYELARQWARLRAAATQRGIALFGDMPIFVGHDSADVWARPHEYSLDDAGMPTVVAGCPPDAFSATGQRWGNPLYRWDLHAATGFAWWTARFRRQLSLFDVIRIDHFIGFHRYWEIPASEPTAVVGRFLPGPRDAFFAHLRATLGRVPIVAEDLGIVTPEVTALRERWGFPGMRVLQFSFAPSAKDVHPHTIAPGSVVYTGTHDNDTSLGWYDDLAAKSASSPEAARELALVCDWIGASGRNDFVRSLVREAYRSPAHTAIVPVQDVLGLGTEARMNTPAVTDGNWAFRLTPGQLGDREAAELAALVATFDR